MTGLSVRMHILARKRGAGTHEGIITLERPARSFGKVAARKAMHVSLLTVSLSAGSIRPVIALSRVRMDLLVAAGFVFLLTLRNSSDSFLSRVLREMDPGLDSGRGNMILGPRLYILLTPT
jgi:hypothetical protein